MTKEPVCPLCAGALAKEGSVWIQTGGTNTLCYTLAWVCKECGAAWPIGLTSGGWFEGWKQTWEDGKRTE